MEGEEDVRRVGQAHQGQQRSATNPEGTTAKRSNQTRANSTNQKRQGQKGAEKFEKVCIRCGEKWSAEYMEKISSKEEEVHSL